jgi:hypothetical protein
MLGRLARSCGLLCKEAASGVLQASTSTNNLVMHMQERLCSVALLRGLAWFQRTPCPPAEPSSGVHREHILCSRVSMGW